MMAGSGVNISGAGMLRTRRKDICIKPNRRLDRKSSRGMIYENEELRLRTIHINAAIEQGQNDIKKLRKENEQLRREIWCLRDEYDKLEEILRKQKCHEGSDDCESRSEETEALLSNSEKDEEECSDDNDEDADNDDNNENIYNNCIVKNEKNDNSDGDNDDSDNDDDDDEEEDDDKNSSEENCKSQACKENTKNCNDQDQENRLKNPETPSEKMANNLDYLHVNFDGLSVVDEEEEQKKVKRYESDVNEDNQRSINSKQAISSSIYNHCPFIFPTVNNGISSQAFKSTSTLKMDTPGVESNFSNHPNSPTSLANFENHSASYTPRIFPRMYQQQSVSFADQYNTTPNKSRNILEENFSLKRVPSSGPENGIKNAQTSNSFNSEENYPQGSKHIFAPLSPVLKRLTRQSTINEVSTFKPENQVNKPSDEITIKQDINSSIKSNNERFNSTEKRKSISLDSLFANKNQSSSINNFKVFSSCQDFNTESLLPSDATNNIITPFQDGVTLNNNPFNEHYIENNSQTDSSKPFRSELSVVLKYPRPSKSIKELSKLSQRKNCRSLNNLFFKTPEISNFNGDMEHPQMFASAPITDYPKNQDHGYQATSFESPYPVTFQIPSMMPIDYKNVPFLSPRGFYYSGEEMKMFYDSIPQKISAQTQTLDEDIPQECSRNKKDTRTTKDESLTKDSSLNRSRRKGTKKEKLPSSEKKLDRKKKHILKNQLSVSSCEESESMNLVTGGNFEGTENKHESRSSSSEVDSHKKDQTHRVSLYFNSKKRPSLTSMKSTRNTDNSRSRIIFQKDNSDGNTTNLGGGSTNSVNNREMGNNKRRKTSTSSENVPWCACWGNGCI